MSSDWVLKRLGDHCEKIGSGATPKGGRDAYLDEGPVRLIRSQNIYNDGFAPSGIAYISDAQAKKLDNVSVVAGDVLLNITGDSVARVCQAPAQYMPARVNQHVAIIRPKSNSFDAQYLRYFLASPAQQDVMLGLASAGATRNALTKAMIEDFQVPCPSLDIQHQIAQALGSLDDRITLLLETNATLEAMAQALFKSWFVDFDPVHAKQQGCAPEGMDAVTAALFPDSFEESELGMVPKGWPPVRLDSFVELAYGKALKAEARLAGDVPVYGSGGITGWHNAALVNEPSIIVGRKGTVGSLYWESRPFFPIDTVFFVKSKKPLSYVFQVLSILGLKDMNTDAAVPGLNRENAYRLAVPRVPDVVITAFDSVVSTLRDSVVHNVRKIESLEAVRDTLLPRLISGQLRLPGAEQTVAQAIAA